MHGKAPHERYNPSDGLLEHGQLGADRQPEEVAGSQRWNSCYSEGYGSAPRGQRGSLQGDVRSHQPGYTGRDGREHRPA